MNVPFLLFIVFLGGFLGREGKLFVALLNSTIIPLFTSSLGTILFLYSSGYFNSDVCWRSGVTHLLKRLLNAINNNMEQNASL